MGENASTHVYFVKAEWDDEASVWFVSQSDVPGLAAEADSPEELLALLETLVPEMVELNGDGSAGETIPYSVTLDHLTAERVPA